MAKRLGIFCFLVSISLFLSPSLGSAQTNSWTNSASGKWEDTSSWSLGIVPGTNQTILVTNAGWKALAIGPNTAENFLQTMTVNSITISSPSNSYNTLLLNYSGTQTPLTAQSLSVGTNSAVTLLSSALEVDGTMDIGGEINQNDSFVTGNQIEFGDLGPAVYNLNSGILDVSNVWVDSGTFNQNGGTNIGPAAALGGDYNLNSGYLGSAVVGGGTLRQSGGTLDSSIGIYGGNYLLDGGLHNGGVADQGVAIQTGGTNIGDINIGWYNYISGAYATGSYTISDGLCSGGIDIEGQGSFVQEGGTVAANTVTLHSTFFMEKGGGYTLEASVIQDGGTMSCSQMDIDGYYRQNGGSNFVAGTLYDSGFDQVITSGWLCASNLEIDGGMSPNFGGTLIVSNELAVYGSISGSGQLIASNITLAGGTFSFGPGKIDQTGILTVASGSLLLYGSGPFNFGQMLLTGGANFQLPSATNRCTLQFGDSSGLGWATNFAVNFQNWSGSLYGGGSQQIIFGNNSAALTSQQLSQIQFQNPAGLPAGNYPSRVLATGEIVPDTGAPLPLKINLTSCPTNAAMQLNLSGDIGQRYVIEVSTDLVNWTWWTNQFNSNGTMSIFDCATNSPQKFYRAHVAP